MSNAITTLNAICKGWSETKSGLLCNSCESGGIIDKAIKSGEWFIIFNDARKSIEGLANRDDAVEMFASMRTA